MSATITKPMLAGKCERPDALNFPVLATPKLDGIRCLKIGGRALTRSFKPISCGRRNESGGNLAV